MPARLDEVIQIIAVVSGVLTRLPVSENREKVGGKPTIQPRSRPGGPW